MSLRHVLFDLTLFRPEDNQDEARKDLGWLLEALVQRDMAYLKDHPETPRLYESGVTYERPAQFRGECPEVVQMRELLGSNARDPRAMAILKLMQSVLGGECFRDIGRILEKKRVDCDNLASWRVAELRQSGIPADPYIKWRRRLDGGNTYHVLVRWPDGSLEDPSLLLGMGGPARAVDRATEIAKNADRVKQYGGAAIGPDTAIGPKDDASAALEDILGRHAEFLDLSDDPGESFDERILAHTGLLRGI